LKGTSVLEPLFHFVIKNRWLIVVLTLAAGAVGVVSLRRLPIDAVPDITNNQVQINILVQSLSPLEIEKQVTFPIETALAGIPGLQSTRSLSRNAFSQVTAVFEDDVNIYFARQQVAERLGEAKESLPPGAEPVMGPIATGLGEIYMYTVEYAHPHGKGATTNEGKPGWQPDGTYLTPEGARLASDLELAAYLREVQDWIIRPQLKGVKDVAGVDTIGGYLKQYHVLPDPMKLVSYGLTFTEVIEALEKNNVSTGAGYIEHKGESYVVRATGRIETAEQLAGIVVGSHNGVPIYVQDIVAPGGVGLGRELRTGSASENGEEVVVGTAVMLLGANSRTVAAAVDARMAEVQKSLPPDIRAKTVLNRTKLVDATIGTVKRNLAEGAALVILVLFLLLGNIRAALITALIIPFAMLVTFTGMVQSRVAANLMSLGAIDFGMLVDGGVIIVENCLRRLAERQHREGRALGRDERYHEILVACRELARPAVYGPAIIVAVFANVLFLTGIEGKMFRPMATTMIFALAASFILALTFIPALVAILIRGRVKEKENFLLRWAKRGYEPLLRRALRWRFGVVPAAVLIFAASLFVFTRLGQEFVPTLDEKDLALQALRIPSTSLTQAQEMQSDLERTLATFPEVAFVYSKTGTAELASDPMPPNATDTFVILKPTEQWRNAAELDKLIAEREEELAGLSDPKHDDEEGEGPKADGHKGKLLRLIELTVKALPGNNYEFTQPIQMRFNELIAGVRGDVAVKVFGDDFTRLAATAEDIAGILQGIAGAADVKVEQTEGLPVMTVDIDRAAIARYGLNVSEVQDVVAVAIGGREAGMVFQGDRRFDIVVRLPDALRGRFDEIERLPIPLPRKGTGSEGQSIVRAASFDAGIGLATPPEEIGFIPLGAVAKIEVAEGVNQISRENGKRRVVVQANIRGRDLGSFVREAQAKVGSVALPPGSWLTWGGQFENLSAARERLSIAVPACLLFILLLLFGLFKSLRHALLVFSGVPLALTGGVLALWLRDMPFSISAAVGFIALSGVAVLNGVVMVEFINQLRAGGMRFEEAIVRGSLTRLRPVLMTALVAALGFVPMALAHGTGAEVQKPLATVVIGGILSSTLLTLVVLPALYRIFGSRDRVMHEAWESPQPTDHA
jgi:cobalt-zinc-cadmium resistance protein CzcA